MKQVKQKQLVGFLKTHNNPSDKSVHTWAQKHNYEIDKVEEGIYRIATKCVRRPTSFRSIRR